MGCVDQHIHHQPGTASDNMLLFDVVGIEEVLGNVSMVNFEGVTVGLILKDFVERTDDDDGSKGWEAEPKSLVDLLWGEVLKDIPKDGDIARVRAGGEPVLDQLAIDLIVELLLTEPADRSRRAFDRRDVALLPQRMSNQATIFSGARSEIDDAGRVEFNELMGDDIVAGRHAHSILFGLIEVVAHFDRVWKLASGSAQPIPDVSAGRPGQSAPTIMALDVVIESESAAVTQTDRR